MKTPKSEYWSMIRQLQARCAPLMPSPKVIDPDWRKHEINTRVDDGLKLVAQGYSIKKAAKAVGICDKTLREAIRNEAGNPRS